MIKILQNPIGEKYGLLTIIEDAGWRYGSSKRWRLVKCRCECGNSVICSLNGVRRGNNRSCGCMAIKNKYSSVKNNTPEYLKIRRVWAGMVRRCYDPKEKTYSYYGGRGISVCNEWRDCFPNFYKWAISGFSIGLQLDRINNNGNYEPQNCRWTTREINGRNKRNSIYIEIGGINRSMKEWAQVSGVPYDTIRYRRNVGWPINNLLDPILENSGKSPIRIIFPILEDMDISIGDRVKRRNVDKRSLGNDSLGTIKGYKNGRWEVEWDSPQNNGSKKSFISAHTLIKN